MPLRKKILIGFFLLLITSGFYGLAISPHLTIKEKRQPAPLPQYKAKRLLKSRYYLKLGDFLNDSYPYRSPFIIAKNWVDYYIFSTSPSDKVHLGAEGWLYLKSGLISYLKNDCGKKEAALELARELNSIEQLLASAGKRFFFIVAPDKAAIYPEFVRVARPLQSCGKSFYDLFIEALDEYPVSGFIRLDKRLLEAKEDSLVYYQRGTHWTDGGAFLVSRIILERLSTPSRKFGLPDMKFRVRRHTRDLAAMFLLNLQEKSDYIYRLRPKNKITVRKLKPLKNGKPRLKITAEAKSGLPLLPRAIIYRDSFMTKPLTMIYGSFTEIETLWTHNLPLGKELDTDSLRASKIVLIEVVERNLDKLKLNEKELIEAIGGGMLYKRNNASNINLSITAKDNIINRKKSSDSIKVTD